jgi:putative copper export protein/mono/diheme cytochrome c family protein
MLAGLMSFVLFVAEPAWARALREPACALGMRRQLIRFGWTMLGLSIVSGAAWLVLLASRLGGQSVGAAMAEGDVWKVLTETRFGHDWIARALIAGLIGVWLARFDVRRGSRSRLRGIGAVALSSCFMATLAWAGHGGGEPGISGLIQVAGDGLHLVAAGAWIGGLVPFALVMAKALRARDEAWTAVAADVTRRFSAFGVVVVSVLMLTGLANTWFLVGSFPRLIGTAYGQLLLGKIALVIAMVAVAGVNRLVLMPRLDRAAEPASVLGRLRRNGLVEIGLGLAILAVVGTLGTMPPAAHTQVQWPLPFRLSGVALYDPATRTEALVVISIMAAGAVSILAGVMVRRLRWPAWTLGGLLLVCGAPYLAIFTTEAYPTSFYASPTGFSVQSIAAGETVFAQNCTSCHGPEGRGNGPAAKELQPPPADLTAPHIYNHSDGDLFWWITHGIGDAMPPFEGALDPTARWNLIDFIHANSDARRFSEAPGHDNASAFRIPDFTVECPDGSTKSIRDLRGRVLNLVFAGADLTEHLQHLKQVATVAGATEIVIRLDPSVRAEAAFCSSDDPDIAKTFALYAGSSVEQLDGTELIVDQSGSLRGIWRPGAEPDWTDPKVLAALVESIRRTPSRPYAPVHVHAH